MQFLIISKKDTLQSISRIVGSHNIDAILSENGIKRVPNVGVEWNTMCDGVLESQPNDITPARKSTLLNSVVDSQEVFEKLCLLDEDGWKIFSAFQAFRDAIRVPESIRLPFSSRVIGSLRSEVYTKKLGVKQTKRAQISAASQRESDQSDPVNNTTYRTVMNDLKKTGEIHPENFNRVNTQPPMSAVRSVNQGSLSGSVQWPYKIPWGKILIYSTIAEEAMDIPAYPEQVDEGRVASYASMPDLLYQYEPWIMYESSGPREQNLAFHLHRDMWTGNHHDGKANELIRFCQANTFPLFNGSTIDAPLVKIYIDGKKFIAGVMTRTDVSWKGPIGQDNWFLEFDLTLTIQEVSDTRLDFDIMRNMPLIGY